VTVITERIPELLEDAENGLPVCAHFANRA
jgi:hypothetical protein